MIYAENLANESPSTSKLHTKPVVWVASDSKSPKSSKSSKRFNPILNDKYDDLRVSMEDFDMDSMTFTRLLTVIKHMPVWHRVIVSWQTAFVVSVHILSYFLAKPIQLHTNVMSLMTSFTTFLIVAYFSYALKRYYDLYFYYMSLNGCLSSFMVMTGCWMKQHKEIRDRFMRHSYAALVIGMVCLKQNEALTCENCLLPLHQKHDLLTDDELAELSLLGFSGLSSPYLIIQWLLEDFEEFLNQTDSKNSSSSSSLIMYGKITKYRSKLGDIHDTCAAPLHINFIIILRAALLVLFAVIGCFVGSHHGGGKYETRGDSEVPLGYSNPHSPFFNSVIFLTVYVLLSYILQYSREIEQPFGNYIEDFPIKLWMDRKITSCKRFHAVQDSFALRGEPA